MGIHVSFIHRELLFLLIHFNFDAASIEWGRLKNNNGGGVTTIVVDKIHTIRAFVLSAKFPLNDENSFFMALVMMIEQKCYVAIKVNFHIF